MCYRKCFACNDAFSIRWVVRELIRTYQRPVNMLFDIGVTL